MAHADWKRYYCVVYDRTPAYTPAIWRKREDALRMLTSERGVDPHLGLARPIGIAGIRGNKRNPQLQTWLLEHSR